MLKRNLACKDFTVYLGPFKASGRGGSVSGKLALASAFRHLSSQSGTGPKKCRTVSHSGTGPVPTSFILFTPVPDCIDAGWSDIPVFSEVESFAFHFFAKFCIH
jgi:hypothetical protein